MATTSVPDTELQRLRGELGAEPDPGAPLRVAIVTPYHAEPDEVLTTCLRSVQDQTHAATHIVVADGLPSPVVDAFPVQHVVLPRAHANYGGTPRAVGSFLAVGQGFDAIAYLDGDNWYEPDHVQAMIELHRQSGASVCVASRTLNRLDGSLLDAAGEHSDGTTHVDTSCLFLTAPAFQLTRVWGLLPGPLRAIDDRFVWAAIRSLGVRVARRRAPTVHYRTSFRVHYEERGEAPPPGSKSHEHVTRALAFWKDLPVVERELVFRRLGFRF